MKPAFRFIVAASAAGLMAIVGYALTNAPVNRGLADQLAAWPDIASPVDYSNSSERFISDLAGMYLFGRSPEMLQEASAARTDGETEDSTPGLDGITLIAIAGLDEKATAIIDDESEAIISLRVGDLLAQAWIVQSISRDSMVVENDGEVRTLFLPSTIAEN